MMPSRVQVSMSICGQTLRWLINRNRGKRRNNGVGILVVSRRSRSASESSSRAAAEAGNHEFLLARVADDLIERLAAVQRCFPVALDLAAHHGLLGRRLRRVPGIEMVVEAEAAWRLLEQCDGPRVQAGEEALPFRDQSLGLVVSGLSLHLVNDLPGALVQIRRALKPDGLF